MNYKILTEYPDENLARKWNDFLEHASLPTHYITPNFFVDPLAGDGEKFAILAFDRNEKIIAVLTGNDAGKKIVSGLPERPQTAFRKDANQSEAAKFLLEGLKEKGGRDLELITFYTWKPIIEFENLGFQTQVSKGVQRVIMLDLSKGAEELFKEFSESRRNGIRKALKKNLEVKELETDEELKELYEIHVDWNARKKIRPLCFEVLRKIAFSQKENRKILIAKHEEKVIAGCFYRYCRGGVVEYSANNSLSEFQKFHPNELIHWYFIKWACEAHFSHYSMGASHMFLQRFGGDLCATHRYQLDCTLLKLHRLTENTKNFGFRIYQNLPIPLKTNIKKLAGKLNQ